MPLDTNIVSYFFRHDSRAKAYERHLTGQTRYLAFVTLGELYQWLFLRPFSAANKQRLLEHIAKLTGIFEALKSELRFAGGRDLLDRVTAINEFRNTKVAHQETPLADPAHAKAALVTWVDGLNRLWQANRKPA
jgi:hypothetical protein